MMKVKVVDKRGDEHLFECEDVSLQGNYCILFKKEKPKSELNPIERTVPFAGFHGADYEVLEHE